LTAEKGTCRQKRAGTFFIPNPTLCESTISFPSQFVFLFQFISPTKTSGVPRFSWNLSYMCVGGHDRGLALAKLIELLFPPHMTEAEQADQLRLSLETSHDPRIQLLAWIGLELASLRRAPPSKGYEPALAEEGFHGLIARDIAKLAVRAGNREAKESKLRRPVFDAIKFLATPRQRRAILSRCKLILAAWNDTSIVETLFSNAGQSETEFVKLLEAIVQGRAADLGRLAQICAGIAPTLSLDRGPKVSRDGSIPTDASIRRRSCH
jgi:hypothetical protein